MTSRTPETDSEWIVAMVELEEERGMLPPGGASGGVARRGVAAAPPVVRPKLSAATRARNRVRLQFQAVDARKDEAA